MRKVVVFKTYRGDWIAECPSLPGCTCRAETKVEVLDSIKTKIDEYITELQTYNAPIPDDHTDISVIIV